MDCGEVRFLEAPAKVLKLSEAMRIGAKLRPQGFVKMFTREGASCALGAAYEGATGGTCGNCDYSRLQEVFPVLGTGGRLNELGKQIYRMNDGQLRTREAIADYLESEGY